MTPTAWEKSRRQSTFPLQSSLFATFSLMVGPQGRVVGVEHILELVSSSIENIQKSVVVTQLTNGSLSIHVGGMVF
ncbi:hypothetical protein LR48_Vigan08g100300 [Vigna angularis]|uniref:Uncharacterized protein n=1 Tax=Phaseolus angularis TaxID=3914 RepID=A0A0L9V580_PHAAN|nr:hypothetical protein LR48_Vigan08g100300 [Vigna angularis]